MKMLNIYIKYQVHALANSTCSGRISVTIWFRFIFMHFACVLTNSTCSGSVSWSLLPTRGSLIHYCSIAACSSCFGGDHMCSHSFHRLLLLKHSPECWSSSSLCSVCTALSSDWITRIGIIWVAICLHYDWDTSIQIWLTALQYSVDTCIYYPVDISITVVSYSCTVQYHAILHGCYCKGWGYTVS